MFESILSRALYKSPITHYFLGKVQGLGENRILLKVGEGIKVHQVKVPGARFDKTEILWQFGKFFETSPLVRHTIYIRYS